MSEDFGFLDDLNDETELLRKAVTLEKGKAYPVYKFEMQEADQQNHYKSLKAFIMDEGFKFFIYMPKKFSRLDNTKISALNASAKTSNAPSICFYGVMGRANIVEILKPGEQVNKLLLSKVAALEAQLNVESPNCTTTPEKRKSSMSEDESPAKKSACN